MKYFTMLKVCQDRVCTKAVFFCSRQCRKYSKTGHIARMCHQQQLNSRSPTKSTSPTQGKAQYVDQGEADEAGIDTSSLQSV